EPPLLQGIPFHWLQNGTGATPAHSTRPDARRERFSAASALLQPRVRASPPASRTIQLRPAGGSFEMTSSQLVEVEDTEVPRWAWEAVGATDPTAFLAKGGRNGLDTQSHRSPAADRQVRDLQAENARLRDAARLQAELLASVAHDLQTPLSSV